MWSVSSDVLSLQVINDGGGPILYGFRTDFALWPREI